METKNLKIAIAISQKANVPLMIWGTVGVSKTQQIIQYCEFTKQKFSVIVGSAVDPTDVIGHFIADKKNKITIQTKPRIFQLFETENRGVIFLDEYNNTPRDVKAVFLKLIDEKRLGEYKLNDQIFVIAACNPAAIATNAENLDLPTKARFCHIKLEPRWEDLVDFIDGNTEKIDKKVEEILQKDFDEKLYKKIFRECAIYCATNNIPIVSENSDSEASELEEFDGVPTFRTLDFAAKIYTVAIQNNLETSNITAELMRGCIGKVSVGLLKHLKKFRPPKFEEIIQNLEILLDREIFAFCVPVILENINKTKEIEQILKFLKEKSANTELTVLAEKIKENVDKIENVYILQQIYLILNTSI